LAANLATRRGGRTAGFGSIGQLGYHAQLPVDNIPFAGNYRMSPVIIMRTLKPLAGQSFCNDLDLEVRSAGQQHGSFHHLSHSHLLLMASENKGDDINAVLQALSRRWPA